MKSLTRTTNNNNKVVLSYPKKYATVRNYWLTEDEVLRVEYFNSNDELETDYIDFDLEQLENSMLLHTESVCVQDDRFLIDHNEDYYEVEILELVEQDLIRDQDVQDLLNSSISAYEIESNILQTA